MTADQIATALEDARELARAGVPLFLARPATDDAGEWDPVGGHQGSGYWFPAGWQHSTADPAVVDSWRPGMALCAVMGHAVDALDVDPRNGGEESRAGLMGAGLWPRSYGTAATPSGGTHDLVAALGVASLDNTAPGVDVKAGRAGSGHGFVFIAPTVKLSKSTGELAAYTWTARPVLPEPDDLTADDSGAALAELIRGLHGGRASGWDEPEPYDGPPFADLPGPVRVRAQAWTDAAVRAVADDLAACADWPEGYRPEGRGWERKCADAAWRLGRLARATWSPLTVPEARAAYLAAAPTSATWTRADVEDKWNTQHRRKAPAPWPTSLDTDAAGGAVPEPSTLPEHAGEGEAGGKPLSVASQLVRLADTRWTFATSTEGEPFALPIDGPPVVRMLTGSRGIRAELADLYQARTGKVAGQQALADAVLVLEGRGRRLDPVPLALRVARDEAGAVWLDLGTLDGRAVRITPSGWSVVDRCPVLFRRTALTGGLPDPEPGGTLEELWRLLNVAPESRPVLLAWLVAALLDDVPHPAAALVGEQGTGKSTASRMLTALLDPSPAQLRKPPRDVEGWTTAAAGSWVVGVDNVSTIPAWWSDSLCRAVTGDGDVRRRLYSDGDLTVFAFRRVVLLNGIDLGAVRDDLAERLLTVELERITERRYDADLTRAWEAAHPRILGALLDLAARVLAVLPDVVLDEPPRMADFARVLAAVDQVLSTRGLDTYTRTATNLAADAVTGDPVLTALTERVTTEWVGTAAQLLDRLGDPGEHRREWPKDARGMTTVLRRRAPSLRRLGWTVDDLGRGGKDKLLRFRVAPPAGGQEAGIMPAEAGKTGIEAGITGDPCPPRNPALTCEDSETGRKAGKAGDKSEPLSLDQSEREERGGIGKSYGETMPAMPAMPAEASRGHPWTALARDADTPAEPVPTPCERCGADNPDHARHAYCPPCWDALTETTRERVG